MFSFLLVCCVCCVYETGGCWTSPWMYRAMVSGTMVAGRWLTLDAERLAAWRRVVSEFEEETRSCLIQTGASFSSNLKHGSMPAW